MPKYLNNDSLVIPSDSLVVLVGAAASGKTTFCARYFSYRDVLSTDRIREQLTNDPACQDENEIVFRILYGMIDTRLRRGLLTVVDSTGLSTDTQTEMELMAKQFHRPLRFILFDVPLATLQQNNIDRSRHVPKSVLKKHRDQFVNAKNYLTNRFGSDAIVLNNYDAWPSAIEVCQKERV